MNEYKSITAPSTSATDECQMYFWFAAVDDTIDCDNSMARFYLVAISYGQRNVKWMSGKLDL